MDRYPYISTPAVIIKVVLSMILLLGAPTASAGAVYGMVTKNGGPQVARFEFINRDTGDRFQTSTDDSGRFELILPPGHYRITSDAGTPSPKDIIVFHEPKSQDIRLR